MTAVGKNVTGFKVGDKVIRRLFSFLFVALKLLAIPSYEIMFGVSSVLELAISESKINYESET